MSRTSRRRLLQSAGAAGLLAAGPAVAQGGLRDTTITMSSTSFATAAVRVAQALGLFAARGIGARIVVMDSANAATAALISGSADFAVSGPGELIAANARGQPVLATVDLYRGFSASLVLSQAAAAQSGVDRSAPALERLKALNGMLIASPSATSAYTAAFRGAADSVGAKIRFTFMAQGAMAAALEGGAIGGFISGAPFWGFPVVRGTAVLWLSGPQGELPPDNTPVSVVDLQAMRPFTQANPSVVQAAIQTVHDFGVAVQARPDAVKAVLAKLYPDVDTATMNALFSSESGAWVTRPLTPADMRHEIDFVRSSGTAIPGLDQVEPASLLYRPLP